MLIELHADGRPSICVSGAAHVFMKYKTLLGCSLRVYRCMKLYKIYIFSAHSVGNPAVGN